MRQLPISIILTLTLLESCVKPYELEIIEYDKAVVVDGIAGTPELPLLYQILGTHC